MRLLRQLATLGLVLGVSAAPGRAQPASPLSGLPQVVRSTLERSGTPGAAVGVVVGDRLELAEGIGVASVETQAPITADTLFQLGSLTKVFTATAVLVAAERGLLDLERPAGQYVRGLAACLAPLTLRQLLSHTAGLIDEPDEYGPHDERALGEYIRSWTDEYCLLPPGRVFSYSNSGYALAGLVLQEALGKPYAELMQELVFTPLGMTRTTFRPTVAMTYPLSVGHRVREGRTEVVRPMADDARLWPAGEMYSSVNDVARFAIALLNDGWLDGRQVLPRTVVDGLREPRTEVIAAGEHYGFGLWLDRYRGIDRVAHAGTMPGFQAMLSTLPSRRAAVIVLANRDGVVLDEIAERAFDSLFFDGRAPEAQAPPSPIPLDANEPEQYAGRFTNPRRWTLEIVATGEGLVLRQFNRDTPLVKVGARRFLTRPPAGLTARPVVIGVGPDGRAEFVQFGVWAFAKVRPAP